MKRILSKKMPVMVYIREHAGNKTMSEIAAATGYSRGTIASYASYLKVSLRTYHGMNLEEYVKKWAGIKSAKEMAIAKECSLSSIYTAASRTGVSLQLKNREDAMTRLIEEHGENLTAKEIAAICKRSYMTVYARAYRLGIALKSERTLSEKVQIPARAKKNELFNYNQHSNWLV